MALWATPRTASTAFERMVIQRGDHLVLDEPFSRSYYLGPQRLSDRFPLVLVESTFAAVHRGVLEAMASTDRPLFVKDMAYQVLPALTEPDELLGGLVHTFLVRDPRAALSSLARRWPDFTPEESGYTAQHELFDRVREAGRPWVVLDSDDLRADPEAMVRAWCEAVGIEHRPEALSWTPGMRPEWPLWNEWYEGVARTTGFQAPGRQPVGADAELAEAIDAARPHYEALAGHRLGFGDLP